jgi:hypothetical protein
MSCCLHAVSKGYAIACSRPCGCLRSATLCLQTQQATLGTELLSVQKTWQEQQQQMEQVGACLSLQVQLSFMRSQLLGYPLVQGTASAVHIPFQTHDICDAT